MVLQKNPTGFALFNCIFLRNQSMSNTRWFCDKNIDNHSYLSNMCAKEVLDSNFNQAGIDQIPAW